MSADSFYDSWKFIWSRCVRDDYKDTVIIQKLVSLENIPLSPSYLITACVGICKKALGLPLTEVAP